jgi:hypothetical protein
MCLIRWRLPGEHAYSHVNAFSSAIQAYLLLGSEISDATSL